MNKRKEREGKEWGEKSKRNEWEGKGDNSIVLTEDT